MADSDHKPFDILDFGNGCHLTGQRSRFQLRVLDNFHVERLFGFLAASTSASLFDTVDDVLFIAKDTFCLEVDVYFLCYLCFRVRFSPPYHLSTVTRTLRRVSKVFGGFIYLRFCSGGTAPKGDFDIRVRLDREVRRTRAFVSISFYDHQPVP